MDRLKIICLIKRIKNFFDKRKTNKLEIDKPKKKIQREAPSKRTHFSRRKDDRSRNRKDDQKRGGRGRGKQHGKRRK